LWDFCQILFVKFYFFTIPSGFHGNNTIGDDNLAAIHHHPKIESSVAMEIVISCRVFTKKKIKKKDEKKRKILGSQTP